MCVVSFVGDVYSERWRNPLPWQPFTPSPIPTVIPVKPKPLNDDEVIKRAIELTRRANEVQQKKDNNIPLTNEDVVTREEFIKLEQQVKDMQQLLIGAKQYDIDNNEPNCEMKSKVKLLKQMAELFGIDLKDVFEED